MPLFGRLAYNMQPVGPSIESQFPAVASWQPSEQLTLAAVFAATVGLRARVRTEFNAPLSMAVMIEIAALYTHIVRVLVGVRHTPELQAAFVPHYMCRVLGQLVDSTVSGGTAKDKHTADTHGMRLLDSMLEDVAERHRHYALCAGSGLSDSDNIADESQIGVLSRQLSSILDVEDTVAWRKFIADLIASSLEGPLLAAAVDMLDGQNG